MTDKQLYQIFDETSNYADPDAYASDVALSLLDPEDPSQEPDAALFEALRTIWHVSEDPFKALLERMGLTQTECSLRFCIPRRTVQNWAGGVNSAPSYLRLMMAELSGIVKLRDE